MRVNDRDVSTPGEGPYLWRSKEVERQRVLEASGVLEAARHPRHGQAASLKKTLAVCIVALAAVGAMVAGGLLTQGTTINPEPRALFLDGPPAAPAAEEAGSQAVAAGQPEPDPAAAAPDKSGTEVAEPNRASCAAIRGTAYESERERGWFLANCIESEPVVAFLGAPELSGVVSQPEVMTSSGPAGVTAAEAIASSIDWITNQRDAAYDITSESCSASEVGALWLVSCETSLSGCDEEVCTSWTAVCVTDVDGAVLSSRNC